MSKPQNIRSDVLSVKDGTDNDHNKTENNNITQLLSPRAGTRSTTGATTKPTKTRVTTRTNLPIITTIPQPQPPVPVQKSFVVLSSSSHHRQDSSSSSKITPSSDTTSTSDRNHHHKKKKKQQEQRGNSSPYPLQRISRSLSSLVFLSNHRNRTPPPKIPPPAPTGEEQQQQDVVGLIYPNESIVTVVAPPPISMNHTKNNNSNNTNKKITKNTRNSQTPPPPIPIPPPVSNFEEECSSQPPVSVTTLLHNNLKSTTTTKTTIGSSREKKSATLLSPPIPISPTKAMKTKTIILRSNDPGINKLDKNKEIHNNNNNNQTDHADTAKMTRTTTVNKKKDHGENNHHHLPVHDTTTPPSIRRTRSLSSFFSKRSSSSSNSSSKIRKDDEQQQKKQQKQKQKSILVQSLDQHSLQQPTTTTTFLSCTVSNQQQQQQQQPNSDPHFPLTHHTKKEKVVKEEEDVGNYDENLSFVSSSSLLLLSQEQEQQQLSLSSSNFGTNINEKLSNDTTKFKSDIPSCITFVTMNRDMSTCNTPTPTTKYNTICGGGADGGAGGGGCSSSSSGSNAVRCTVSSHTTPLLHQQNTITTTNDRIIRLDHHCSENQQRLLEQQQQQQEFDHTHHQQQQHKIDENVHRCSRTIPTKKVVIETDDGIVVSSGTDSTTSVVHVITPRTTTLTPTPTPTKHDHDCFFRSPLRNKRVTTTTDCYYSKKSHDSMMLLSDSFGGDIGEQVMESHDQQEQQNLHDNTTILHSTKKQSKEENDYHKQNDVLVMANTDKNNSSAKKSHNAHTTENRSGCCTYPQDSNMTNNNNNKSNNHNNNNIHMVWSGLIRDDETIVAEVTLTAPLIPKMQTMEHHHLTPIPLPPPNPVQVQTVNSDVKTSLPPFSTNENYISSCSDDDADDVDDTESCCGNEHDVENPLQFSQNQNSRRRVTMIPPDDDDNNNNTMFADYHKKNCVITAANKNTHPQYDPNLFQRTTMFSKSTIRKVRQKMFLEQQCTNEHRNRIGYHLTSYRIQKKEKGTRKNTTRTQEGNPDCTLCNDYYSPQKQRILYGIQYHILQRIPYPPGTVVMIQNLKNQYQYNGTVASIVQYIEGKDKYIIIQAQKQQQQQHQQRQQLDIHQKYEVGNESDSNKKHNESVERYQRSIQHSHKPSRLTDINSGMMMILASKNVCLYQPTVPTISSSSSTTATTTTTTSVYDPRIYDEGVSATDDNHTRVWTVAALFYCRDDCINDQESHNRPVVLQEISETRRDVSGRIVPQPTSEHTMRDVQHLPINQLLPSNINNNDIGLNSSMMTTGAYEFIENILRILHISNMLKSEYYIDGGTLCCQDQMGPILLYQMNTVNNTRKQQQQKHQHEQEQQQPVIKRHHDEKDHDRSVIIPDVPDEEVRGNDNDNNNLEKPSLPHTNESSFYYSQYYANLNQQVINTYHQSIRIAPTSFIHKMNSDTTKMKDSINKNITLKSSSKILSETSSGSNDDVSALDILADLNVG